MLIYSFAQWRPVLSVLCCYSRITEIGQFIKNKTLFLKILEAGKSKVTVPAGLVSCKGLVSAPKVALGLHALERRNTVASMEKRGRAKRKQERAELGLLTLAPIPPMRVELSWPNHLLKFPPLDAITMALTFQHEFGRNRHSNHRKTRPRKLAFLLFS